MFLSHTHIMNNHLNNQIIENASKFSIGLNVGLIGAAGYSGLMIWHGGISGSALVKISLTLLSFF